MQSVKVNIHHRFRSYPSPAPPLNHHRRLTPHTGMICGYASYLNNIMIKQGRFFTSTQTATVDDGTYSFEVPYSTLCPIPGETNFDTRPTGPYTITARNLSKTVDVTEQDVLNCEIVNIYLMWFLNV